jgi:hypothetical protein
MATFSPVCPQAAKIARPPRGTLQGDERLSTPLGGYFTVLLEGFGRFTPMTLFG